jgi:hypothetical protein
MSDLSREVGASSREIADALCCSRQLSDALVTVGKRRVLPRSSVPLLRAEIAAWRAKEGRSMPTPSAPVHMARQGYTASTNQDSHALEQMPPDSRNPVAHLRLQDARPRPLLASGLPVSSEKGFERAQDSAAEADNLRRIYEYVSELSRVGGVSVPNLLRQMLQNATAGSAWQKSLQTLLSWSPNE